MTPPAAAAAPAVQPRRPAAPAGPRRVSGPARRRSPDRPARSRRAGGDAGLIFGLIASLEGLSQHRLIDRLIRGRIWIGLVAFALIGIVTLQLGLLKLNGGIGRALEHEAMLQRENAALSIENSELAAGERIEKRAGSLGMISVPTGALSFLSPHRSDAAKAAAALKSSAASSEAASEAAPESSAAVQSGESQTSESGETQATAESSTAASSPTEPAPAEGEASSSESATAESTESPSSETEAAAPGGGTQGE